MPWIYFDQADRNTPLSSLEVMSVYGRSINLGRTQNGQNRAVFFMHSLSRLNNNTVIDSLVSSHTRFVELDTSLVLVLTDPTSILLDSPVITNFPGYVISDPLGTIRSLFTHSLSDNLSGNDRGLLFVLDQYGALYTAYSDVEFEGDHWLVDLLSWLEYIEIQCPE